MNKIIGRKEEIKLLAEASASKKASLVAIYGRRRVGKTCLIHTYYEDHIAFELTGQYGASLKMQLKQFSKELQDATGSALALKPPETWVDAFHALEQYLVMKDKRKKGYTLGIAAFQLTGNPSYQHNLVNAAKEPMQELTKQLNETSLLAMIRNNKRVILHMVECNQVLQVKALLEAEVYNTSTGRLLMAYLEPKELNSLIKAIGLPAKKAWPGAETRQGLEKELKKIRQEEFVQAYSVHHTVGFAVPVFKGSEVVAGLSIFVPESRYTDSHKEKIFKLIHKAAKQISDGLV